MAVGCLNCGKQLGSQSQLCHSCQSAGVSPEVATDVDEGVKDRVERSFIIASLQCPNCHELHTTVTVDGKQYPAADYGIETLAEWEHELDKEATWLREHRRDVEAVLPFFEDDWPRSVATLRAEVR